MGVNTLAVWFMFQFQGMWFKLSTGWQNQISDFAKPSRLCPRKGSLLSMRMITMSWERLCAECFRYTTSKSLSSPVSWIWVCPFHRRDNRGSDGTTQPQRTWSGFRPCSGAYTRELSPALLAVSPPGCPRERSVGSSCLKKSRWTGNTPVFVFSWGLWEKGL